MHRHTAGGVMTSRTVCSSAAALLVVFLAAELPAQTNPQPGAAAPVSGSQIVAVGCVNRAVPTGSLSPTPGVPAATPNSSSAMANSTDPTGAYLLAGATPPNATDQVRARAAAGEPVSGVPETYVIDGPRQQLAPHAGHLVEITGTLKTTSEGDRANRSLVKHLQLGSLKMLAPTCPKTPAAAK